ncbi:MAG TPA: GspH/FimT family pseudopilin [Syntrophorhabdaceae bacterium]|jgi:prepilin-type N-terminal cleavage/methylation domain-containing protein|nr:GspH/FimT family pseudopilin [Pseudomonadota bacterium]HOF58653.1 GspH/FimT family pseudopilin [Syntrophorhabdaceae bacterium]HOS04799.1 GspH/FimT family pseudopilin [Syntrophorhabdaceae bacterium]HPL41901.1 GspH/FimT family pseudopilin [Syntrophorhabdaceae bacterium]HPN98637.1 GspH/FimT family pseudopilin [Syntrophorhabdaceae bacterium]
MKKDNGFTIIELMLVVVIAGILATLSVAGYRNFVSKYEINSQTRELYSDLMSLRMMAMQKNRMTFVQLSNNSYIGYEDTDPQPDGNETLDTGLDSVIIPSKSVKNTFSYTGGGFINFNSRGFSNTTCTICILSQVNPSYDCIKVSSTRVTIGKIKNQSSGCTSANCETQ